MGRIKRQVKWVNRVSVFFSLSYCISDIYLSLYIRYLSIYLTVLKKISKMSLPKQANLCRLLDLAKSKIKKYGKHFKAVTTRH